MVLRHSVQNCSRLKLGSLDRFFNIARADTFGDARSETVRFADLNINNSPGVETLYRRLSIAAKSVCRESEPGRSLALVAPHRACVHSALSKALADVGNPAVLAYARVAPNASCRCDRTYRAIEVKGRWRLRCGRVGAGDLPNMGILIA